MKKFFYQQVFNLTSFFKPITRVRLAIKLIDNHLKSIDSVAGYKLRRHLLDKYTKSYPRLYSHEATRIYGFYDLFKELKNVPGDLVECGVGRGRFFTIFAFANQYHKLNKALYGFDSFSGFPISSAQDYGTRVKKEEKITGWDDVAPEMIYHVLENDIDAEGSKSLLERDNVKNIKLVPGFFDQTLKDNLPDQIAFLHLDADLYQSTVDILVHCLPRMSAGSIMVFDELHEKRKVARSAAGSG